MTTNRIFPKETSVESGVSNNSSMPVLDTISDVLTLLDAGVDVNAVGVLDEDSIYLYYPNATSGDFEDTTNGGYWNKITSDPKSSGGEQLSFDITNPQTQELFTLSDNIVVNRITLKVYEPFDSGVQIEIGDNVSSALFMASYQNKPTINGTYQTYPEYMYKNVSPNVYKLKIKFLNLNSSNGKCIVSIEYSDLRI